MSAARVATVLIGPPCAGKTTLVDALSQGRVLAHFGVRKYGELLVSSRHPLGEEIRGFLDAYEMIPDALVRQTFEVFVSEESSQRSDWLVIEGYPRTPTQCADLNSVLAHTSFKSRTLVEVRLARAQVEQRAHLRRQCRTCGRSYVRTDVCRCGAALSPRPDDAVDRVAARYGEYERSAAKVRCCLKSTGWRYIQLDGQRHIEENVERVVYGAGE